MYGTKGLEWRRVIFSNECPFELIHAPNRQNDHIWAPDRSNIQLVELVKHLPKIHVWGMISYQAVSDLHMIDPGQTVTADYYVSEILMKTLSATYKRKRKTGSIAQRKMMPTCPIQFINKMVHRHITRESLKNG